MQVLKGLVPVATLSLLFSACSADSTADETLEVVGQGIASACLTADAVKWQFLANFAVAVGEEMGTYNVTEQFEVVSWNGTSKVALTAYGESQCAAHAGCQKVKGYLVLQEYPSDIPMFGSSYVLNIQDYRETMITYLGWARANVAAYTNCGSYTSLPEDHTVTYVGDSGTATCGGPFSVFDIRRDFHLSYSSAGPIAGKHCVQLSEPADPDTWNDNYLCSERDLGFRWSNAGPINGMYCTAFNETADPYTWNDNYLCAPEDFGLTFSSSGIPSGAGTKCIAITEAADPHTWGDNYLCWNTQAPLNHPSTLAMEFYMFGGSGNPYLDFTLVGSSQFKIDPTDYTSGTNPTGSTGGCVHQLPYESTDPSVAGACCYVRSTSTYGRLMRYPTRPNLYYCKTQ